MDTRDASKHTNRKVCIKRNAACLSGIGVISVLRTYGDGFGTRRTASRTARSWTGLEHRAPACGAAQSDSAVIPATELDRSRAYAAAAAFHVSGGGSQYRLSKSAVDAGIDPAFE